MSRKHPYMQGLHMEFTSRSTRSPLMRTNTLFGSGMEMPVTEADQAVLPLGSLSRGNTHAGIYTVRVSYLTRYM